MNRIDPARHPLLHRISKEAEWVTEDQFPSQPEWADEHEVWLQFVDGKGELSRFLPRLKKSVYQRDRALAEIGIGHFLEVKCFLPILEWEPNGNAGKKGEFLVGHASGQIFVEVKTGGWEKDIKDAEGRDSPRLLQPKYINGEARSVGPWEVIRNAVSNAYPKFPETMPTLLIIRDDYFTDLDGFQASIALYCPGGSPDAGGYLAENGYFLDNCHERLGAVGVFRVELPLLDQVHYHFSVYDNLNALQPVRVPRSAFTGYPRYDSNNRPK